MKKVTVDGNEACAMASYMFTEMASIYPITPSSSMAEHVDKWSALGRKNIFGYPAKVTEMQSEAGAIGMAHGALQAGILSSTYTASQGLLLMIPNMYKIAGECLPFTMHVAARSLATHALSIFGDHQDIYATRGTGFCMMASSSVQDAYYLGLISHLASIKSSLPFLHFFDGFRTSHEINKIDVLEEDEIRKFIPKDEVLAFRNKALNIFEPVTRGTNQNGDIYFQMMESRNKFYDKVLDNVCFYMNEVNKLAGTDYKPFNYYGSPLASKVIVAMGSVCETIKQTIDYLGGDLGLIEVHLYRPFSNKCLLDVLPSTVSKVAVLDRTKEPGSNGEPLYLDVSSALKDKDIFISHGRYGLSGKDTTPSMIKAIYDSLDTFNEVFTVGICDDVTNLSLSYDDIYINDSKELLIYGYGSDGMVSASKILTQMTGDHSDAYVQGYFEYDSKKSGGVTISHLRFSSNKIRSPYCVRNPWLVVVTKDTYFEEFDPVSNILTGGILIINTSLSEDEVKNMLKPYARILNEKSVKVYVINAYSLARKYNLGNKISMIMEGVILKYVGVLDYSKAIEYLSDYIETKFSSKGSGVVLANKKAILEAPNLLYEVKLDNYGETFSSDFHNLYEMIAGRRGNELKVSDFKGLEDGTFKHMTTSSHGISEVIPKWISSNCIQCGMCSLACPHGVIRPFVLDEDEYLKAPDSIKNKCVPLLGKNGYYYTVAISSSNCTGCGVCVNVCPGKKDSKALVFSKETNDFEFNYLDKNVSSKDIMPKYTIKGSQFVKPKFAFHGACAGCGETAYIKLLTQLFGENLMIANATGCSSIYGASLPNNPYSISWANSLFEDNAEYGFGIMSAYEYAKEQIYNYMKNNKDELFDLWLSNPNDFDATKKVFDNIDYDKHPFLLEFKNYIVKPRVWAVGGDGWAYDIGFGGIDQVLSSGKNIKILVLDSQVYSNTGGQASKSTPIGAKAEFAFSGKENSKKDLARICMCYPNTYVAQVSLGANMMQVIKAFKEADMHDGPAIIIAYTPCIAHGISCGMSGSVSMEALASKCGYFPTFRYDGKKFTLDSKNPDFDLYDEFLAKQRRFSSLKSMDEERASRLLLANKEDAIKRFEYYKSLSE